MEPVSYTHLDVYKRQWHHYEDDEEMESIEDMTQQHINREIHFLRRA